MAGEPAVPRIKERFIYTAPFRDRKRPGRVTKVRILNADGHIDYAHQKGLKFVGAEMVDRWEELVEDPRTGTKRSVKWCIMRARVVMADGTEAWAHSCVSSEDNFVNQIGREVEVAETRAKKRALADAANITEEVISPDAATPTREAVDMGLEPGDAEEPAIPADARTPAPAPAPAPAPVSTPGSPLEPGASDDQFQI